MEYIEHGDIGQHLHQPWPETEAKSIALQLLEGLELMHRNAFTHRDLKPQVVCILMSRPYKSLGSYLTCS